MKVAVRRLPSKGHNTPQTPTRMCTHHQQSWASLLARGPTNADKPERCMMHSRLTSRGNFLSLALRRISPCPRQLPGNSHPAQPPCATGTFATCWHTVVTPRAAGAMPRTAMGKSGHAQVPTLLVALVRRQAGRAGWRAEIAYKNREDWNFQKEKRHQFEGFAFHNIFKGCLYLFIRQHGFF